MYKLYFCNDEDYKKMKDDHIIDVVLMKKRDPLKIIQRLLFLNCMYCHCYKISRSGKEEYFSSFGPIISNII